MLREEQTELVTLLRDGDIRATADPAQAETNRPCVLVAPPTLNLPARAVEHRLFALTSHPAGTTAALAQLDVLVTAVVELLPVERAEPTSYALTPASDPVPAYLLTLTGSI